MKKTTYKYSLLVFLVLLSSCVLKKKNAGSTNQNFLNNITIRVDSIDTTSSQFNYLIKKEFHVFLVRGALGLEINNQIQRFFDKNRRLFMNEVEQAFELEDLRIWYADNQSILKLSSEIKFLDNDFVSLELIAENDQPIGTFFPTINREFVTFSFRSNKEIKLNSFFKNHVKYDSILTNRINLIYPDSAPETFEFYLTRKNLVLVIEYVNYGKVDYNYVFISWQDLLENLSTMTLKLLKNKVVTG